MDLKDNAYKNKQKGEKNKLVTAIKIVSLILVIFIQIVVFWFIYVATADIFHNVRTIFVITQAIVILTILYRHDISNYKISWILLIMFMPIAGILLYVFWGNSRLDLKHRLELSKINDETKEYNIQNKEILEEIKNIDVLRYNQMKYINNVTGYSIYNNSGANYLNTGEMFFENVLEDLKKAQKYILIEFYIISKGKLFDEIVKILKQKAKSGVRVEIIYDALGTIATGFRSQISDLEASGIKLYKFNPFKGHVNLYLNYRDHRKIIVIDGIVSYTGGINIADEYANLINRFGYWKDNGIRFVGDVSWSFTLMVLKHIELITKIKIDINWYKANTNYEMNFENSKLKSGYVFAYSDGPDNLKHPSENIYIQTINMAKSYIYITTPYLAMGESLLNSLLSSARSGVTVKIIVPYIPDKKIVNIVTKSYYEVLLEAGVKIYEYKPGFIHSKTFLADDEIAIVGTANLDFRSLHINYECASMIYKTGEELVIKNDMDDIISNCIEIKLETWQKRNIFKKISEVIMSAFSPMF